LNNRLDRSRWNLKRRFIQSILTDVFMLFMRRTAEIHSQIDALVLELLEVLNAAAWRTLRFCEARVARADSRIVSVQNQSGSAINSVLVREVRNTSEALSLGSFADNRGYFWR
jgi:hypothetical protein